MTDRPYRPSNGTAGDRFAEKWCDRCEGDHVFRVTLMGSKLCPIHGAALAFNIGEPDYPKEWVCNADGYPSLTARCTAFEDEAKVTDELREYRKAVALGQKDLFEEGT